jgi:hypothetical protein
MVASAVVISSQTTSIRAANLLASFIIVPMALLVQASSVMMFYGDYEVLWWMVVGLGVVTLILGRMGVRIFNREEILAKEGSEFKLTHIWRDFKGYFLCPPDGVDPHLARFNLWRLYRHDLPLLLKQHALPLLIILLVTIAGAVLGMVFAWQYPLPPNAFPLHKISPETFAETRQIPLVPQMTPSFIFGHNLRAVSLAAVSGMISFGASALLLAIINAGFVSFIMTQVVSLGYNP